jgi:hypothetical protein
MARTAAERETDLFQQQPQPPRSVSVAFGQDGGLLDERLAAAGRLVTPKTADPQIDHRLPTGNR